jgi:phosphoribosylamine--glycine ligase
MKILILGSGGREHALAWAVKRSQRVTEVVCAPGNGGIAEIARCLPVDLKDVAAMVRLVEAEQPALTIVGPEVPLSLGIVDALQERGLRVFGPTRAAAMLESSKGFAKRFLQRHNIPTANYAVCATAAEIEGAIDFFYPPIVVKADGLHAGKGVIICESRHAAIETAEELLSGRLLGAKATRSASFASATESTWPRWCPRRITSASARATPAPTPAAWASTRPTRCSSPQ